MSIFSLLAIVSCGNYSEKERLSESKPNIILILVDDLGKEWVSCYGADNIETPNVDALAESGMLFNNFYAMPQCTPTRTTLLTGQYPFRHGWVNHWDVPRWGGGAHFDESLNPSIGIEMKKAGYKTCIAGKWQIDDFRVEPDALTKNGFDEYCMWTGYEGGIPASSKRYQNPYIFINNESKTFDNKFGPDIFKDFIVDFIHTNKESPFFIYYPMVLTHTPLVNTPDEIADTKIGKHKAMVRYTDKITGEIIKALDDAKIRDNTIVIWTTDNGTTQGVTGSLNGQKVKGGKSLTIEAGICLPFIVSWPDKIKPNQKSEALIDLTDLYPTFSDLAGRSEKQIQEASNHIFDGHSFKDVLLGKSQHSNKKWILGMGGQNNARLTEKGVENQYVFRDRVLRNERYKLYVGTNRQSEKFYDLQTDPFEKNNLIDSLNTSEREKNFKQLADNIKSFPEKDNDPIYKPNPPQNWDVKITAESEVWKLK
ncbi:MAG: sulfatase-like hydrolase/transferase [Bacteroidetes bacterium]|nr:sulfatase-like hydrolase/transferase [Bacteroidota bacterium]